MLKQNLDLFMDNFGSQKRKETKSYEKLSKMFLSCFPCVALNSLNKKARSIVVVLTIRSIASKSRNMRSIERSSSNKMWSSADTVALNWIGPWLNRWQAKPRQAIYFDRFLVPEFVSHERTSSRTLKRLFDPVYEIVSWIFLTSVYTQRKILSSCN